MGMKRKNTIYFKNGTTEIIAKKCGKCEQVKPIEAFWKRDLSSPWPSQRYQSRCKICAAWNANFRIKNATQSEYIRRQKEAIEYARS
jgi:hypothetical protein